MKRIRIALPLAAAAMFTFCGLVAPAHAQREGDIQAEDMRQAQGQRPFGPAYRGSGRNAEDWAIDSRLQAAAQRIDRGRGKGITKKEAKRLSSELQDIRNRVSRMRSDGRLGARERNEIDRRLDQLERNTRSQQFD